MKIFTNQNTAIILRQVYIGNITAMTAISTTTCYLRPLSEIQASTNGLQFGVAHNAIFEVGVDIQENDRVQINGQEYTVKGVATFQKGGQFKILDYKRALITLPEKR